MSPLAPWLPPDLPDLALLAMEAADAEGLPSVRAWPEAHRGGLRFGSLPTFLCWSGTWDGAWHLLLLQPREVGSLVPGAKPAALPEGWLGALDLGSLARPLARHPDFPGGASVHVAHLPGGAAVQVRSWGSPAPGFVAAVLDRVAPGGGWILSQLPN